MTQTINLFGMDVYINTALFSKVKKKLSENSNQPIEREIENMIANKYTNYTFMSESELAEHANDILVQLLNYPTLTRVQKLIIAQKAIQNNEVEA